MCLFRYNASQLEDWCRLHGWAGQGGVASQLIPIVQASKLLQMKKSSPSDVDAICDLCTQLNALQVRNRGHTERIKDHLPEAVLLASWRVHCIPRSRESGCGYFPFHLTFNLPGSEDTDHVHALRRV